MHQPSRSFPHDIDVAIIGAGPIGIEAAIALTHAGLRAQVIEAGNVGSTFTWWAPGTRFFSSPERISIAGVPLVTPNQDKATREEYLAYLRSVVQQFNVDVRRNMRITHISRDGGQFRLSRGAEQPEYAGASRSR